MAAYYDLIRHDGNKALFTAIEMSIASQVNGHPFHIHIEGLRGTGKTTIMRAAKQVLPPILRIKNCAYNCDPQAPHCPDHHQLSPEEIRKIGTEIVPRPFLEISHSAKVGTVVGSIDLGKLTDSNHATAALLLGTIPKAHRGIIFIDEINRLADTSPELADVLLDVMGTKPGRLQIEEPGFPNVELPISVSVWAASNPDEDPGPLQQIRKQLSDRFDYNVQMGRPLQRDAVYNILTQQPQNCSIHPVLYVGDLQAVQIDPMITSTLASIYIDFGIESLRALEALQTAACLYALQQERKMVTISDVATVIPFVFGHRVDADTLEKMISYLQTVALGDSLYSSSTVKSVKFENVDRPSAWLHNLWTRVRASFSRKANANSNSSAQKASSGNGAGTSISANPKQVIAPPKKALSLENLTSDKLLTVETKETYDRKH